MLQAEKVPQSFGGNAVGNLYAAVRAAPVARIEGVPVDFRAEQIIGTVFVQRQIFYERKHIRARTRTAVIAAEHIYSYIHFYSIA